MRYIITLLVIAGTAISIHGQTYVRQDASGNNDGSSWADAYSDLQDALEQSLAGDQIWIAAGKYVPKGPTPDSSHFVVKKAIKIYGGFIGIESVLEDRNWETNPTILSGDINGDDTPGDFLNQREDNAHHVVVIQSLSGTPHIDGLILEGGTTRLDNPYGEDITPWEGGAMFIGSNVTLKNCHFQDNNGYLGAAVDATITNPLINELAIENCLFKSNRSVQGVVRLAHLRNSIVRECSFQNNLSQGFGGAMVIGNSSMTIEACNFEMNESQFWGGAIAIFQNSATFIERPSVHLRTSTFRNNLSATYGGAVAFQNGISGSKFLIDSCEFMHNIASGGDGGALRVRNLAFSMEDVPSIQVRIHESDFIENSARFGGGLLCWSDVDSMTIEFSNTRLIDNSAASAGGLYVLNEVDAQVDVRLTNVEFSGNTADWGAGGLFLDSYENNNSMRYEIDSCSFTNNVAGTRGGGIWTSLDPLVHGAIGSIRNSSFIENIGMETSGAINSLGETLLIENCLFLENFTEGTANGEEGGGATLFGSFGNIEIINTIYENNLSLKEGSAVLMTDGTNARFENVLFRNNTGNSTIYNKDTLHLLNVTMVDNERGLVQQEDAYAELQNTILDNTSDNFIGFGGDSSAVSRGGNISSDNSMVALLKGYGDYQDLHETNPGLDMNFVPMEDSPCVDKGNPEGMSNNYDLAGEDRVQGIRIDIGAYESPFLSAIRDIAWNAPELNVFPNPVQQNLQFQIEDDWIGILNVSIYNLLGRKVHVSRQSKTSGEQLFQENVSHLTSGEYILLVSSTDDTYASKIIVQN